MNYDEVQKWAEDNRPNGFFDIEYVTIDHRDLSSFNITMAKVKIIDKWIVIWSKNHPTLIYRKDELISLTTHNEDPTNDDSYLRDYLDDLEYVDEYDPYDKIER